MKKKILTIVICCYNSTKTILSTLDSIDVESNKDVDVFVIDDGSKDDLKGCIRKYLDQYPDTVHYFRKENGNWGSCMNFAISKANSRFLSVLDSDDQYNKKSLMSVVKILKNAKPDTDIALCNYEFHYINERSTKVKQVRISKTNKLIKYVSFKRMSLWHIITIHSTIFAVDMLKTINPLPSNVYYSDNLLIYQALLRVRNVAYLNNNIYLYQYFIRSGNQSISIERSLKNFHHFEIIYKLLLDQTFFLGHKRAKISKRCISLLSYWMLRVLANDFSRKVEDRCKLLKGYMEQYEECAERNHVYKFWFHTPITRIIKHCPRFAMWMVRVVLMFVKSGFMKATDYSPEGKRNAKAFAKAQRKAWRLDWKEKRRKKLNKS